MAEGSLDDDVEEFEGSAVFEGSGLFEGSGGEDETITINHHGHPREISLPTKMNEV